MPLGYKASWLRPAFKPTRKINGWWGLPTLKEKEVMSMTDSPNQFDIKCISHRCGSPTRRPCRKDESHVDFSFLLAEDKLNHVLSPLYHPCVDSISMSICLIFFFFRKELINCFFSLIILIGFLPFLPSPHCQWNNMEKKMRIQPWLVILLWPLRGHIGVDHKSW